MRKHKAAVIEAYELDAAADEIERLRAALKLMVSTYPYSPPCHGWEAQVEAHKAAKAALTNS